MTNLYESILSSTKSGKTTVMKNIARKLAQKTKSTTKYIGSLGEHFDSFGNIVEIGDIVLGKGSFSTNIIEPLVIIEFDIEEDIKEAIHCWNPYKDKVERTTLTAIVKLNNPEKYL